VFEQIAEYVTGSPWTYGVVLGVSGLDAFFPVVPSETVVITAGTLAADGGLLVYLVIPAAALGAFAGDNISYFLGHRISDPACGRLFRGDRGRKRLNWARRMLDRHGALVIVAARFIPGGRTATTFAAGMLDMTWKRFAVYDAVAVVVWATYSALIGFAGGSVFQEDVWKALAFGFGIALGVAFAIEGWRRVKPRP
jgi:membrane protein DedA with SNARE-associated domain